MRSAGRGRTPGSSCVCPASRPVRRRRTACSKPWPAPIPAAGRTHGPVASARPGAACRGPSRPESVWADRPSPAGPIPGPSPAEGPGPEGARTVPLMSRGREWARDPTSDRALRPSHPPRVAVGHPRLAGLGGLGGGERGPARAKLDVVLGCTATSPRTRSLGGAERSWPPWPSSPPERDTNSTTRSAVIVGRAQLLLVRETDPGYDPLPPRNPHPGPERPPHPARPHVRGPDPATPARASASPRRSCRNCLRDLRDECRGAQGPARRREPGGRHPKAWADPDALRHLTEILPAECPRGQPRGGMVRR